MRITERGKAFVASQSFAEDARQFVKDWITSGKPETQGRQILITRAALTLIERDGVLGPALTQAEGYEFGTFVDEHLDEINAALNEGFNTLLSLNADHTTHQDKNG